MTKKEFTSLVAKKISGTLSKKESIRLSQIVTEDSRLKTIYDEINHFMQKGNSYDNNALETKLEEVWDKISISPENENTTPSYKKKTLSLLARVAAIAAIITATIILIGYNHHKPEDSLPDITIESGSESLYSVLGDGSRVWLNKNSQIIYNTNFGIDNRKIRLIGEAFFDVAHHPEMPLIVSAKNINIEVKGTAFNVDATSKNIEVELIRGLVALKDSAGKHNNEILLHPNQKIVVLGGATLSNDSNYIIHNLKNENDTANTYTRWIEGSLVFQKQRFADLIKLMEERYNTTIRINNQELAEQRFTGSIKNETLQQILDALKQSYPFEYKISNTQVVIY